MDAAIRTLQIDTTAHSRQEAFCFDPPDDKVTDLHQSTKDRVHGRISYFSGLSPLREGGGETDGRMTHLEHLPRDAEETLYDQGTGALYPLCMTQREDLQVCRGACGRSGVGGQVSTRISVGRDLLLL